VADFAEPVLRPDGQAPSPHREDGDAAANDGRPCDQQAAQACAADLCDLLRTVAECVCVRHRVAVGIPSNTVLPTEKSRCASGPGSLSTPGSVHLERVHLGTKTERTAQIDRLSRRWAGASVQPGRVPDAHRLPAMPAPFERTHPRRAGTCGRANISTSPGERHAADRA
jgi:hypothetical protein